MGPRAWTAACALAALLPALLFCIVPRVRRARNLALIKAPTIAVTGASSGIGRAFCRYLAGARRGYHLVLVARRRAELEALAAELAALDPAGRVTVFAADMGERGRVDELLALLRAAPLGAFVHAAGLTHRLPDPLPRLDQGEIDRMLGLMVVEATYLVRQVAGLFAAQGHGLFVQMSSGVGVHGAPLLSVYSAAKAYLSTLMTALNAELGPAGARFVAACPLWVSTPMTMTTKTNLFFLSPDDFVARLFAADLRAGTVVTPYWAHRLVLLLMGALGERGRGRATVARLTRARARMARKLAAPPQ